MKTHITHLLILIALFAGTALHGANVLLPLETCGVSPAANRSVVLTPIEARGASKIPVLDKIQTNTDVNGNVSLALMPGVYQAQVRPAWGQVGITEFYFFVDPSNAVQNAFTNLLTGTNNTWPPNQYAYSAQASDARYLLATGNSKYSTNAGTANNALALNNIPASLVNSAYSQNWKTNDLIESWDADTIQTNNLAAISSFAGINGNLLTGSSPATYTAFGGGGYPALLFTGGALLTNAVILGNQMTNAGTVIMVYREPYNPSPFQGTILAVGADNVGVDFAFWSLQWTTGAGINSGDLFVNMTNGAWYQFPNQHSEDDIHIFSATWNSSAYVDYLDGKMMNNSSIWSQVGAFSPIYFWGTLCVGSDFSKINPGNFYLLDLQLYGTNFIPQQMDAACNSFISKYTRLRPTIVIAADSMAVGVATKGGTLVDCLSSNFQFYTIDNLGIPGQTSTMTLNEITNWAKSSCYGWPKIAINWFEGVNDGVGLGFLNTTTNNVAQFGQNELTNGWLSFSVNPPSCGPIETNGQRFLYNSMITNCLYTNFTAVIDLSRSVLYGLTNQCTNPIYFASDMKHFTNAAYIDAVQSFFAPIINYYVNGSTMCTTTQEPPPNIAIPWQCIYQGHYYYSSNGAWAFIH